VPVEERQETRVSIMATSLEIGSDDCWSWVVSDRSCTANLLKSNRDRRDLIVSVMEFKEFVGVGGLFWAVTWAQVGCWGRGECVLSLGNWFLL
jgi:hypothetical protein